MSRRTIVIAFAAVAIAGAALSFWTDPPVFLASLDGAAWIRPDRPWDLAAKPIVPEFAYFRKQFRVPPGPRVSIQFRSVGGAGMYLDGRLIQNAEDIGPGDHELIFVVQNRWGPALLRAYCPELKFGTGRDWEAGLDGRHWAGAVLASDFREPELSGQFPSILPALLRTLPVFLIGAFAAFLAARYLTPESARNSLFIAWGVLAANNFFKLPWSVGFDAPGHLEYIRYMAAHWSPPLPSQGWVMFEPPLYYFISAFIYKIAGLFLSDDSAVRCVRLISVACGAIQVQIAYRLMKRVFPDRKDVQMWGIVFAGMLPMNLYISQSLGNEPLAGAFSAIVLYRILAGCGGQESNKASILSGLWLGLAMLTKASAALLIAPLLCRFVPLRKVRSLGVILATAFLVCGWYYLGNWIHFGKPFVSGWDPVRGILWRQEPGYRTWSQIVCFGHSLVHPVYSGPASFWDSIYSSFWLDGFLSSMIRFESRPPWNYAFMVSGAWIGLLPAGALAAGIIRAFRDRRPALREAFALAAIAIAAYFAALLFLFVRLPIYATAKATYTVGLLPCYVLLFAGGLDWLLEGNFLRRLVTAAVAAWGLVSFLSYFVL